MDFKVDYKLEGKYADDIILLATSEAELQELVDRLDRVSRRYSLLSTHQYRQDQGIMASDGIACRILIRNEQLAQVNTFPYLGYLITEDGECTTEFPYRVKQTGRQSGHRRRKYGKVTAYRFQRR